MALINREHAGLDAAGAAEGDEGVDEGRQALLPFAIAGDARGDGIVAER